jgi:RpiR family transcriptional regulator, carbohydrate utilization regulator
MLQVSPQTTRTALLLHIRAVLPTLNEQEQKVGQYVLAHPEEVVHLSVSDMADRCGASDATVFRFSKRVGAEGYQDFKIRLAQELHLALSAPYPELGPDDTVASTVTKVFAADAKALDDTLSVLDVRALERAADAILAARRVDIYGSGGGAIAALELQYKLIRLGVRAVASTDSEMQTISATLLTSADVAIGISHSGEAPDISHALAVAGASGATTVGIVNHTASPIAKAVKICLATSAQEMQAHGYPLGARVAQVGLIDALYAVMILKQPEASDQSLKRVTEALHERRH